MKIVWDQDEWHHHHHFLSLWYWFLSWHKCVAYHNFFWEIIPIVSLCKLTLQGCWRVFLDFHVVLIILWLIIWMVQKILIIRIVAKNVLHVDIKILQIESITKLSYWYYLKIEKWKLYTGNFLIFFNCILKMTKFM